MENKKSILYSYCLRYDVGSAPNPFWGICTLAICKPVIRRIAQKDDWIVGTGSKDSPIGDISSHIVYAMKVTNMMSMKEYDDYCLKKCANKIPKWDTRDYKHKVGDSIYDYSKGSEPAIRMSVHDERNKETDLGGEYVLLSFHFYYFGDNPKELPKNLHPIIKSGQGHKSKANEPYVNDFIKWINKFTKNRLYGKPQIIISKYSECSNTCPERDLKEASEDELKCEDC